MLQWALLGAWINLCVAWAALLAEQRRFAHAGLLLEPVDAERGETAPRLSVIVPVRNASEAAARCASTVLAQRGVDLRLILVDDRSDPDQAAMMMHLASRDDRVALVRVDALPDGWLGKSHALDAGMRHAGDAAWTLFLDDDCVLESPTALATAVACAERLGAAVLTLWPRHGGRTLGEHLIIPLCGGVIALWFGPRRAPWSLRRAYGNGQFLLLRPGAYTSSGGHAGVRTHLIEDVALADAAEHAGLRVAVASGARLFSVRMYDSTRGAIDGWTRIFVGALRSWWRIALSMLWLAFGSLLPMAAAPFLVAATIRGPVDAALLAADALCTIHLTLLAVVSVRFWRMGGCPLAPLALYPLSVLLVLWILARALWRLVVVRRVVWRGVSYRIDRRGRIVAAA